MGDALKYYVYVSDTKVDMLYPQIPRMLLENIASELSINLNVLGTGIGATIKPNQPDETRFSKLRVVTKYIEKHHNVGTVDAPQAYVKGTLLMKWGIRAAALFTGPTDKTDIILTGSTNHLLIAVSNKQKFNKIPGSWTMGLRDIIGEISNRGESLSLTASPDNPVVITNEWKTKDSNDPWARQPYTADEWSQGLNWLQGLYSKEFLSSWPVQSFEFLAKTLVQRQFTPQGSEKKRLLLVATPIYVAMAD